jgi:ribose 5-phosphate isomerase B
MKIALSTDHAGYEYLQKLETFLTEAGHECVNYGPTAFDADDDYPDFIFPAARAVAAGECEVGIIYGGSGQGEAIVANRVSGVRAAVYYGPAKAVGSIDASGAAAADDYEILRLSRTHNNANILSLGARFLEWTEVEKAVTLWLSIPFPGEERHARRVAKIDEA